MSLQEENGKMTLSKLIIDEFSCDSSLKCFQINFMDSRVLRNLLTVESTGHNILSDILNPLISDSEDPMFLSLFIEHWIQAKDRVKLLGWVGEDICKSKVFWIPGTAKTLNYGFLFENIDGTSFVVSSFDFS